MLLRIILRNIARFVLSLRYKIEVVGKEKITSLAKEGGVLFLPNHPSELDPLILFTLVDKEFRLAPLVASNIFEVPGVSYILRRVTKAIPVPNTDFGGNDYTKMLALRSLDVVSKELQKGRNFLIYPSGRLKIGPEEDLGGASGIYQILQAEKNAKVVIVRTTGLWGSSFSRAQKGESPDLGLAMLHGLKIILSNLIFFIPRRKVKVEFDLPKKDLRTFTSKMDLNDYLNEWYNAPFKPLGEPLYLVKEQFWSSKLPKVVLKKKKKRISLKDIPEHNQLLIRSEVARITKRDVKTITPDLNLAKDLGLDSLEVIELIAFLDEHFEVKDIHPQDLVTVLDTMAAVAQKKNHDQDESREAFAWPNEKDRPSPIFCEGSTLQEVFLNACKRYSKFSACSDDVVGVLSYQRLLFLTLYLSKKIKALEGEKVGILMPASVASTLLILATLFAGKIPVMLNWTLGSKNLGEIVADTKLRAIISSSTFLEQARVMDLKGIDPLLVLLEDLKGEFSPIDYVSSRLLSKYSVPTIIKRLNLTTLYKEDSAVFLFTSGTESKPKGVPLTHDNILSNQRDAYPIAQFTSDDVIYSFLPPFHSFGFCTTSLLPLFCGVRVAFSPDPTDGFKLARGAKNWRVTILCAAPTFLSSLFRSTNEGQLKQLRLVISGAEKAPKALFETVKRLGDVELLEGYGITECGPILTLNRPRQPTKGVGKPLEHVELAIIDLQTKEFLPPGKEGLIVARGPNIFHGYLQRELAPPFFTLFGKQWYNTGDLGFLDSENNLFLSGRLKRFVKVGGEMVNLVAIEEALLSWLGSKVGESAPIAVAAKEKEGEKPQLTLFSTLPLTLEEVNRALKDAGFSSLIKLSQVKQIESLPLLGTGKINYRLLDLDLSS